MSKQYEECVKSAKKRTDLSLCPRGYCTAKDKFKVYPSAYANGYAIKVCKGSQADAKGIKKEDVDATSKKKEKKTDQKGGDLHRWFSEKWVNVCEKDTEGNFKPCGRKEATLEAKKYPYCRPLNKLKETEVVTAKELSPKEIKEMCAKKKSIEPGVGGKPTRVMLRTRTSK